MTIRSEVKLKEIKLYDDKDEEVELPYRYYDIEENYWELRHKRGDVAGIGHNQVVDYFKQLVMQLYRSENYTIDREVNFYETFEKKEKPRYPDIFVIKSKGKLEFDSYHVGVDGPAPQVIVEILSTKTRTTDLYKKPSIYERWGVQEYFVYDYRKRQRKTQEPRLWGWRLVQGRFQPLEAGVDGRMWSEQLASWLVPDGEYLRLYDKEGNLRLTGEEAARLFGQTQQHRADAEQHRAERLAQKLRELGIDPDEI